MSFKATAGEVSLHPLRFCDFKISKFAKNVMKLELQWGRGRWERGSREAGSPSGATGIKIH